MEDNFLAMVVEEIQPNKFERSIKERKITDLSESDVIIQVHYSSLNYKDALSASGHKGITRKYPHTPGIDASGVVVNSKNLSFKEGDEVLVTGYDLGMNTSGGFGQYISVPASWVVKKPDGMTLREVMIYGTAGFTAGIGIYELQKHNIFPNSGKMLVTGATGGVGSLAVAMLAKAGYSVVCSTGKVDKSDYLKKLGASEVITRQEVNDKSGKPLLPKKWAGAIDTVGGNTLSTILKSAEQRGCVTCSGLVESPNFEINVYPFIIRGVSLIGIDSAERPMDIRLQIWENIQTVWRIDNIEDISKEVELDKLTSEIDIILAGNQVGRVLVKMR